MPRSAKEFDVLPYEVREGMFIVDADGEHICHCPHPSLEVMQTVATVKAQLADLNFDLPDSTGWYCDDL
jgi:hypothetical protein